VEFQVIKADEMEVTPRGRKSSVSPDLIKAISRLKAGEALKVSAYKATSKKDKGRVSARIRQAAKAAGVSVKIFWTLAGVPQVQVEDKS
jgi:hypothetical protein